MLNVLNDVRFTFSLAVALGNGLFEQPVGVAGAVHDFLQLYVFSYKKNFQHPASVKRNRAMEPGWLDIFRELSLLH